MSFYYIRDANAGKYGKFYTHEKISFDTTYLHITKSICRVCPPYADIIMMSDLDLSKFINLEELTYEVKLEDTPIYYEHELTIELNKTILDLSKCVQIKRITLINVGQKMLDNLNLNNCIELTDFVFKNDNYIKCKLSNDLYLKNINFTKNINLKKISYTAVVKDDLYNKHIYKSIIPDLTHNINLTSYSFNIYNGINSEYDRQNQITGDLLPFNIQDYREFFPGNLTEFTREGLERLRSRFERTEEVYRELQLKDETYTIEQIKTKEILNKLEKEYKILKLRNDENKELLKQHEIILSSIESKFNKLEEENKELRKIIDQLRPTKSSYM